jgi:hypothetical protein
MFFNPNHTYVNTVCTIRVFFILFWNEQTAEQTKNMANYSTFNPRYLLFFLQVQMTLLLYVFLDDI